MSYTGAWRRRLAGLDGNPDLGSGVDRRHLKPEEPIPAVPNPEHGLPVVPTILYAGDPWMLPPVAVQLAHPPLDNSPQSPAAGGADRGAEVFAHFDDDGGPRRAHYYQPGITREADSTYVTERGQAAIAVSQSRGQLVQGIDRDGESPQGHYVMRWIDRRVDRRTITPDAYPKYPYRAFSGHQTPAPAEGDGNQYTSPFAKITPPGAFTRRVYTPQVRRTPPQYAELETVDGTEGGPAAASSFWEF